MARRRIFWHIGPDDLGTGFIGRALDVRRDELAAAGVLVAGDPASWELASAELLGTRRELGYSRAEVDGRAAELTARMWAHKGTSVLSTPGLASADAEQVRLALDGVRDAEVHLVLVVRDAESQAYAGAQSALERGATTRPSRYVERVLDPASDHAQAAAYRRGHDLADIERRWGRTVLPEHVHVIAEHDPETTWKRLTELLGVDVALPDGLGPVQLSAEQLEVLREVALGLDDRLDPRARRTALRDRFSRTLLASSEGGDPLAVALADALVEVGRLEQTNAELVAENRRLDKKRRKHKRRLRALRGQDAA